MPCRDYRDDEIPAYLTKRLDQATRVACELAKQLKDHSKLSAETKRWIAEHDEMDRKRLKEEQRIEQEAKLKQQALSKLTKEEQIALNLRAYN